MKKYIALILVLIIVLSVFGLSGCSENSNTVTLYEFKDNYEEGTLVTKDMIQEIHVNISDVFMTSDGKTHTTESLRYETVLTKENYNDYILEGSILGFGVHKGQLVTKYYITNPTYYVFNADYTAGSVITSSMLKPITASELKTKGIDVFNTEIQYINSYNMNDFIYAGDVLKVDVRQDDVVSLECISTANGVHEECVSVTLSANNITGKTADLKSGAHVNVYISYSAGNSDLLFANVRILSVQQSGGVLKGVTLELTKEQASIVVEIIKSEKLYLGILNPHEFIQTTHDFEAFADLYNQTRNIYETALQLDERITAGIEDPLLIAPEYERLLEQIEALAIQCQAVSVSTQYTQLQTMMNIWITTDIAVYCQNMSAAISRNDASAAERALEYRTIAYNDFMVITQTLIEIGEAEGQNVSSIKNWSYGKGENWWLNNDESVDPDGVLDPEIPLNYIPVPGETEMYAVADENGIVNKYWRLTRTQQGDGSWVWETVSNSSTTIESVPGKPGVYKISYSDGTTIEMRYTRYDNGEYTFVEADSTEENN